MAEGRDVLVQSLLALTIDPTVGHQLQDLPADDGTTAFTTALGTLNTSKTIKFGENRIQTYDFITKPECVVSMIESKLEPRDEIMFLAREMTLVETKEDGRVEQMKYSVTRCLLNMMVASGEFGDMGEMAITLFERCCINRIFWKYVCQSDQNLCLV